MSSQTNISVIQQYESELVKGMSGFLTFSTCFIFLYINMVMQYTLTSKQVFRETSRYILLYNLLLAETFQMTVGQILYGLALARAFMVRYVCLIIIMISIINTNISPLNLAVMSLERYVAVCFPLRHVTLVTVRSTGVVITLMWVVCSVNFLSRVIMLLLMDNAPLNSMMQDYCAKEAIFRLQIFFMFDRWLMCTLFVSVGLVIIFSYVNVILVARSASSDKTSANKASKTLLLHFIQLSLSLSTTLQTTILSSIQGKVDRLTLVRISYVIFVFLINLPRCLSCLIYGLKDQTIRPIFMRHLSFGLRRPVLTVKKLQLKHVKSMLI